MRAAVLVVLAACTTGEEATVEQSPPLVVAAAFARTGDSMFAAWQPSYRYPIDGQDTTLERADELYMRACQLGDHHACLRAVPREAELEVIQNCRAGDATSCGRFESPWSMAGRLPGHAARRFRSGDRTVPAGDLRLECIAGITSGCAGYVEVAFDAPDAEAMMQRGVELATRSCRAGMIEDCMTLVRLGVPGSDRLGDDMQCRWWGECSRAALERAACGDKLGARELYERACQLTADPFDCRDLAEKYTSRELPEPVPGRGARLAAWAADRLDQDLRWLMPLMPRVDPYEPQTCHRAEPERSPRSLLAHTLAARADTRLLDRMEDYQYPTRATDDTLAITDRMYHRACTLGDHRSCWRTQHAEPELDENCRAGDAASCDKLLVWDPDRPRPGDAMRTWERDHDAHVAPADLRHECELGIARSCIRYIEFDKTPANVDPMMARGLMLAGEACGLGSQPDCLLIRGDARLDVAIDEALCNWAGWCNASADRADDPAVAAHLRERQCQLRENPTDCGYLGRLYVDGKLPEPQAGRGRELVRWACAQAGLDKRTTALVGCATPASMPPRAALYAAHNGVISGAAIGVDR